MHEAPKMFYQQLHLVVELSNAWCVQVQIATLRVVDKVSGDLRRDAHSFLHKHSNDRVGIAASLLFFLDPFL